jgi:hypothetical protein
MRTAGSSIVVNLIRSEKMSVVTSGTAREYIDAANLPKLPARARAEPRPPVELKDTDAQALVVGSSLVVAADGVPAQVRSDIVNCTLFAQLAASGRVTDPRKVTEWYTVYFEALTALGWAQHDSRFEEFESRATTIEAHKSVVKVLTGLLGPSAAAIVLVTDTFKALQSMNENSPWITLFDRQSVAVKSARFQVAAAQMGARGLVDVALVAFDLHSRASLTQVLFFKFKANSTRLKYARGNATIYEAALAGHRKQIAERLVAYRTAYIGEIAFPPPPVPGARRAGRRS